MKISISITDKSFQKILRPANAIFVFPFFIHSATNPFIYSLRFGIILFEKILKMLPLPSKDGRGNIFSTVPGLHHREYGVRVGGWRQQ
jgi:hypothetical protein